MDLHYLDWEQIKDLKQLGASVQYRAPLPCWPLSIAFCCRLDDLCCAKAGSRTSEVSIGGVGAATIDSDCSVLLLAVLQSLASLRFARQKAISSGVGRADCLTELIFSSVSTRSSLPSTKKDLLR